MYGTGVDATDLSMGNVGRSGAYGVPWEKLVPHVVFIYDTSALFADAFFEMDFTKNSPLEFICGYGIFASWQQYFTFFEKTV